MDQGQIVEMGNHAELLAQRGRYFNLYTMQWAAQVDGQINA
jgi:ABC-type multidrug transport system fused ATPase/permease subunit